MLRLIPSPRSGARGEGQGEGRLRKVYDRNDPPLLLCRGERETNALTPVYTDNRLSDASKIISNKLLLSSKSFRRFTSSS